MDYIDETLGEIFDQEFWEFLGKYKNKKVEEMGVFYKCFNDQFLEDAEICYKRSSSIDIFW
jgi:hypothetical protein